MPRPNRLQVLIAASLFAIGSVVVVATAARAPQGAVPTGPAQTPAAPAPEPTKAPADTLPPDPATPDLPPPEPPKLSAQQQQDVTLAQIALGERFSQMARDRLRAPVLTGAMWEESRALLKAAAKLSPQDPRYCRLLVEVMFKMGDTPGVIKALNDYRALVPDDRIAQIQLIDVYLSQMEAADKQLTYLKGLIDRQTIPSEVRAHCAVVAVGLLSERSPDEAAEMLDKALELSPNSPEALRLKYRMLPVDATVVDRAGVLLAMLRANCAQPMVMSQLAELLASEGQPKAAMDWYGSAFTLYPRSLQPLPVSFVADYATQALMAGQDDAAFALLTSYLKARPDDVEAWLVRLAVERPRGEKADPAILAGAREALAQRWNTLSDQVTGNHAAAAPADAVTPVPTKDGGVAVPSAPAPAGAPTTAPTASLEKADPAALLAKTAPGSAGEKWRPSLISAAVDIAWVDLYFANAPDDAAKWIDALAKVLPKDNVTLARLTGWRDLVQGKKAEATAALTPIRDKDALAALGLIRLSGSTDAAAPTTAPKTPATKPAAAKAGPADADPPVVKLLAAHRSGMLAAVLWSEVKSKGLHAPAPSDNAPLALLVQKFPKELLKVLENPSAYYTIKAEPVKLSHKYGEPMFVQVSVRNISQNDLTVGADGLIHPDLWFNVEFAGVNNQSFPGVTYDRIAKAVVLRPGEETSQYVRIDQGPVGQLLSTSPSASFHLYCTVMTNPMTYSDRIVPGPAGQVSGKSLLARTPFPLAQEGMRKKLFDTLTTGSPPEKIATLEMMATYIRLIAAQKQPDAAYQALASQFFTAMGNARSDQPIVAAIANYLIGSLGNAEQRQQAVDLMSIDSNWEVRLLGLRAAETLLPRDKVIETGQSAAEPIQPPGEEFVILKEYATAMVELAKHPPATQPATAPAGAGAATNPTTAPDISGVTLPGQSPAAPTSGPAADIGGPDPSAPTSVTIPNVNKNAVRGKK